MITFNSPEEMLETLKDGTDLYCEKENLYAFLHNDDGSIAVYNIYPDEAEKLRKDSKEYGEYWGAFLGPGGHIYDDPSYEFYDNRITNNLDFCKDTYSFEWEDVSV